jgi:RNA polymerase sigma-70 factor (ECF subfamily)
LLRFLRARGAGEGAEDLLQDIWLKIADARTGPVAAPLPYIFSVANRLMIDRHRSRRQEELREREWTDSVADTATGQSDAPGADRTLSARQLAALVAALLDGLEPPRVGQIFRRHRVDGLSQRQVAAEFGVSLSTVEADLRKAYAALADFRERHDEA